MSVDNPAKKANKRRIPFTCDNTLWCPRSGNNKKKLETAEKGLLLEE